MPKLQSTKGGNSIDVLGLARVVDQFRANASLGEEGEAMFGNARSIFRPECRLPA